MLIKTLPYVGLTNRILFISIVTIGYDLHQLYPHLKKTYQVFQQPDSFSNQTRKLFLDHCHEVQPW